MQRVSDILHYVLRLLSFGYLHTSLDWLMAHWKNRDERLAVTLNYLHELAYYK